VVTARALRIRGIVQGVGFRPFIYRLARQHTLAGWVLNAGDGVDIHVEGDEDRIVSFVAEIHRQAPTAAVIAAIDIAPAGLTDAAEFSIRVSRASADPTARISPDLGVCDRCLAELRDPDDRRAGYPYINCTDCGPRYSIIEAVPYDRAATTMRGWIMCADCDAEYHDPSDRRFHAQPNACPVCGPRYVGVDSERGVQPVFGTPVRSQDQAWLLRTAAIALQEGAILAVKGIGGYHLMCDARNPGAVDRLRRRKFRKEQPFAVLAATLAVAATVADVSADTAMLLTSPARPIVLLPARETLAGVAPDHRELGVMLPSTPLQHLLFDHGAPDVLVATSANRSTEPIAYEDDKALRELEGIADAFLIGERPIARRMDDSVARVVNGDATVLRRARGYAPAPVTALRTGRPILALGGDLKSSITLVTGGAAFTSQYLGDLHNYDAWRAFSETVRDLLAMHRIDPADLMLVTDRHPQYRSTQFAADLDAAIIVAVQHHRAHIASVLAERGEWRRRVVGLALDGTGFGDDGTIWGGEVFVGSVAEGFDHAAHLRAARLPGGDAAARFPVQAAAGFLAQLDQLPALDQAPFRFPPRYSHAVQLLRSETRVFATTSLGRLFDTVAALLGFTGPISFEGQAAVWLEHQATSHANTAPYPFPFAAGELDFRPLLDAVIADRLAGRKIGDIAAQFHHGVARGLADAAARVALEHEIDTVVASGGVMQNTLLADTLRELLRNRRLQLWVNRTVPPNDGGVSLGQAALAAWEYGETADA
jgi:hydrogenase maturation protein HypF